MWELKTLGFEISFAFIYFAWSKPHVINMWLGKLTILSLWYKYFIIKFIIC
jgi:hypothetical protein